MNLKQLFIPELILLCLLLCSCSKSGTDIKYNYAADNGILLSFDGKNYYLSGEGETYEFLITEVSGKSGKVILNREDIIFILLPDEDSGFVSVNEGFPFEEERKTGDESVYGYFPSLNVYNDQLMLRGGNTVNSFNGILFSPVQE